MLYIQYDASTINGVLPVCHTKLLAAIYIKTMSKNLFAMLFALYSSVTQGSYGQGSAMSSSGWTKKEIEEWKRWDYDTYGYILSPDLIFPYRQRRAGTTDGLSLLIDPDVDENFCPCTDSEGLKILYHVPLEAPRVADLGSVVGVDREVFLEVNPDLTIADDDIESYDHVILILKYSYFKIYFYL